MICSLGYGPSDASFLQQAKIQLTTVLEVTLVEQFRLIGPSDDNFEPSAQELDETDCWDVITRWCQQGGNNLDTTYRTMRFSVERSDEGDEWIPTLCAFKGDRVICGFNSSDRLTALRFAAEWCAEELKK